MVDTNPFNRIAPLTREPELEQDNPFNRVSQQELPQYNRPPADFGVTLSYERAGDEDTPIVNSRQDKLRKRDLLRGDNMSIIRDYMAARYGQETLGRYDTDEALMERFVDSLRFFNGNVVGTVGEATWVTDANEADKQAAARAYDLFDRLGNVFVVDGVGGALDGIKDYVFAAARDPSNYLGLFTGGAAKAGLLGTQLATKDSIRRAVQIAGKRAVRAGLQGEGREKYIRDHVRETIAQLGEKQINGQASRRIMAAAEKNADDAFRESLRVRGEEAFKRELLEKGRATVGGVTVENRVLGINARPRNILIAAGVTDGLVALGHDVALQSTLIEAGAQEKYSAAQTSIGTILGGTLSPLLLAGGDALGKSLGRKVLTEEVAAGAKLGKTKAAIEKAVSLQELALTKKDAKKAEELFDETIRTWTRKVEEGMSRPERNTLTNEFFRDLIFGENYFKEGKDSEIGGLLKIYVDKGLKIPREVRVFDFLTNILDDFSEPQRLKLMDMMDKKLNIQTSDLDLVGLDMGAMLAASVSEGASLMNLGSLFRRTVDVGVLQAESALAKQAEDNAAKIGAKPNYMGYAQSLWRRMLVSNPATSLVNVAGFAMYDGAQTIAEVLNMGTLYTQGAMKHLLKIGDGGAKEFRQAKHYGDLMHQKMVNFLDPHATRANFEVLLDQVDPRVKKNLLTNLTGGIDASHERFGVPLDNNLVRVAEAVANQSAKATMVTAQDSVTKSLRFMTELDKRLRLKYNRSLEDVMASGDVRLIEKDMLNTTMDKTLESVFSRSYTHAEAVGGHQWIADIAKGIEGISNVPILGQILPFGRFANNVLANTYKFGIAGHWNMITGLMTNYIPATKSLPFVYKGPITNDVREAWGRSTVALSFFLMAAEYDKQRKEEGLAMFDVRVGDTIIDARNSFPLSLFLLGGRMMNDTFEVGSPTYEQYMQLMDQMVVGQAARDFEFGTTLERTFRTLASDDPFSKQHMMQNLGHFTGGYLSGFTRPLDAVNKTVGAVLGVDYVKDRRVPEGEGFFSGVTQSFNMSAAKYLDNLIEGLDMLVDQGGTPGEVPGLTGQTLRVATREGDLRDPNAGLNLFGIKARPGRTVAEEILDSVDMPRYMQNLRGKNPRYDRMGNILLVDMLEGRLKKLRESDTFQRADDRQRRVMIKRITSDTRADLREAMSNYDTAPSNVYLESVRNKVTNIRPAEARTYALKQLKERYNIDASIMDMNLKELMMVQFFADGYKDMIEIM